MFAAALLGALAACNGILGIDAPTLVEAGGTDAKTRDGGPHDATTPDARKDGAPDGGAHDATTSDARPDGGPDATSDGHGEASHDASSPSDARIFDGNCTCNGDACVPILIAPLTGQVGGLAATATGLYFTDDINLPTYGIVGFAPFGGTGTKLLEPDAALPGALAVHGASVYWADGVAGGIKTCSAAHCTPQPFVLDALQYGAFVGATGAALFWSDGSGIHACPFSGCEDGGAEIELPGSKNGLVAVSDASVFWTASPAGRALMIFGCGAAGCTDAGAPLISTDASIAQIGATAQNLYWITSPGNTVWTCPLSNGGADCAGQAHVLMVLPATFGTNRIYIDSTGIYWRDTTTYVIARVPLDGGTPERVVAPEFGGGTMALGSTCVFWSDDSDGGGLKAIAK
jgi:hypothetical protein